MEKRLIQNLPEMNLGDISSGTSSEGESEVVPLDFRTALAHTDDKIMIQAKPLVFKPFEEDQDQFEQEEDLNNKKGGKKTSDPIYDTPMSEDDEFFKRIVRKPFLADDKDVVLIDPGIDADTLFGDVDLPCNQSIRKNNKVDAEVLSNERPISAGWQTSGAAYRHQAFV